MRYELPANHGLSDDSVDRLIFRERGVPALTDAQYAALDSGVGRGDSVLVVSPTSTGKTQIAVWAIANSLEAGSNTVYLVTHRALARQKFEDFRRQLLTDYLDDDESSLTLATGDGVTDAGGESPREPLASPLMVATYEKYLALLSSSGVPADMQNTVIVCDEIQLLGDEHRGRNVEVLLTLLRNAGWKQFVGLSAVLRSRDASDLSNWLGVTAVVGTAREKHLRYECWSEGGIASVSSEHPDVINEGQPIPKRTKLEVIGVLKSMLASAQPPIPIVVFCMRKLDTYELADSFLRETRPSADRQLSLAFDGLEETTANAMLANALACRVATHNADLTDEERHVVEQHLLDGQIDVVFATSTLAAGVNFPFGAAIFERLTRWHHDRRAHVPIDTAEFHNMAGRVGRMGFDHDEGRVVLFARNGRELRIARQYLALDALPDLAPRVTPERFDQLCLQLVAAELCQSRMELERLVCSTFSALRETDRNTIGFAGWPGYLRDSVNSLLEDGFVVETGSGKLMATPVGKAIGHSGLLPETGAFILNYVVEKADPLLGSLPSHDSAGDTQRLALLLFSTCLSCPEFRPTRDNAATRFLPFPLADHAIYDASGLAQDLVEPIWQADIAPINGAKLALDWIEGETLRNLEGHFAYFSAGMLLELFRNLSWILQGAAAILVAATDGRVMEAMRPTVLRNGHANLRRIRKLPSVIRRFGLRLGAGLPDDVLWMLSLNQPNARYSLTRSEILALRDAGYGAPQMLMLGSREADVVRESAFGAAKPSAQVKSNWLRDSCRDWKQEQRARAVTRHQARAMQCSRKEFVDEFYSARGEQFESVFEAILDYLNIQYEKLDDGTRAGAPDYILVLERSEPIVVELKSKQGDGLVDYNRCVEVLAASEIHGHGTAFCVTLCHPGVDPSVPLVIAECGRLSAVESSDFGEALLRLCEGAITQEQLWQWLTTPGQALAVDLPYREYVRD